MQLRNLNLYMGIVLLVASCFVPFLGFWVASTNLPLALKGTMIGLLTVGGPELLALMAIALLGKEAFDLLVSRLWTILSRLAPLGSVSKTRYSIGLVLFIVTFIPSYVQGYAPHFLPDNSPVRLYVNIASDLLFVTSLFVLGGDFWDKLRALFIYNARADFSRLPSHND